MIKNLTAEMTDEKHLPQANVPFDQIAKDLVRTTTHGGKTIRRVSIILGSILSNCSFMTFELIAT